MSIDAALVSGLHSVAAYLKSEYEKRPNVMKRGTQINGIIAILGIALVIIGFSPDLLGISQKSGIGAMQLWVIFIGCVLLAASTVVYRRSQLVGTAAAEAVFATEQVRINKPTYGRRFVDFKELWQYRRLLYFMAWRDIQVRYKQTIFGVGWAIISPLIQMIVFTFVFKSIANVPSYDIPYPVFSYSGLVLWGMFTKGVSGASLSVVTDGGLLTKVYFPRIISPIAKLSVGVVDFFFAFGMLIVLMVIFKTPPTLNIIWLPVFFFLALATALGVGMWLATLNVKFRDIAQFIPFLTQIWMYLSPVPYPSDVLNEPFRTLYGINPMASALDGFRWALLGTHSVHPPALLLSIVVASAMLIYSIYVFRSSEKTFPDYI